MAAERLDSGKPGLTLNSSIDTSTLCDYCDTPWVTETPFGRLCRRDYGYLELATVICYPEKRTTSWAQARGARLRSLDRESASVQT